MITWTNVEKAIYDWVVAGSGLPASSVLWAGQAAPIPQSMYITMRINDIRRQGFDWVTVEDNLLTIADVAFTADNTTDTLTTVAAHGLLSGDGPIRISTAGTLPVGLLAATDYWIIKLTANTFQLAATFLDSSPAGTVIPAVPVPFSTDGVGVHTLSDTADTTRAGAEIITRVRGPRQATLTLQCYAAAVAPYGGSQCAQVLDTVLTHIALPTRSAAFVAAGVGVVASASDIRSIDGMSNSLFESRALVDVKLHLAAEVSETNTFIETYTATEDPPFSV